MDMSIGKGEIVGLAGLLGSGRTETARLMFGIDKAGSGEMRVGGRKVAFHSPREAIREGFAFTPENRKADGIIPHLSVRENIILALQARQGAWRAISREAAVEIAEEFIKALGISTPGPEQVVMNLSGGNQQKVLLARWLATQPQLLILDEPTRGIDVGAKAEIEKLIESLAQREWRSLFISSELEEVVRYCGAGGGAARPRESGGTRRQIKSARKHIMRNHSRGTSMRADRFQKKEDPLVD